MKSLNCVHCLEVVLVVTVMLLCACDGTDPYSLTRLINGNANQRARAREISRVTHFGDDLESYSGYLTVLRSYTSNLFFWFFPAKFNREDAPLLLWLNGGSGLSEGTDVASTTGVFLENGPLRYNTSGEFERNEFSWANDFNMLYIDSPVGAGYSFTRDDEGYATSLTNVKQDLYRALQLFFKLFPEYQSNAFYIGGQHGSRDNFAESYTGRYAPVLARHIHQNNHEVGRSPEVFMNLTGIFVGGGLCAPAQMLLEYGEQLYHAGYLSYADKEEYNTNRRNMFLQGEVRNVSELSAVVTDFLTHLSSPGEILNLLGSEATNYDLVQSLNNALFSTSSPLRQALHVGNHAGYPDIQRVFGILAVPDWFVNTIDDNTFVMDNYKVLQYNGNLDMTVGIPMTEAFLDALPWSRREDYRNSFRRRWSVNNQLAGWITRVGNFLRVIVRNAGHMVPYDQPQLALQMMKSFIFDEPFEEEFQYDWMQGSRP